MTNHCFGIADGELLAHCCTQWGGGGNNKSFKEKYGTRLGFSEGLGWGWRKYKSKKPFEVGV